MQEKELIKGLKSITTTAAGICPFILYMAGTFEDSAFIGIATFTSFISLSLVISIMGIWFRKSELAVLTIGIGSLVIQLINVASNGIIGERYLISMVLAYCYIIAIGTDNYNNRLSIEWSVGAGLGLLINSVILGAARCILPENPGYTIILFGLIILIFQIIFNTRKRRLKNV